MTQVPHPLPPEARSNVLRYTPWDVRHVLDAAVEADYITEEQAAQLAGLFVARAMKPRSSRED